MGGGYRQIVNWDWMNKVEKLMLKVKKGALLGYNSDKWHGLETATQNRQKYNGNERHKDGLKL